MMTLELGETTPEALYDQTLSPIVLSHTDSQYTDEQFKHFIQALALKTFAEENIKCLADFLLLITKEHKTKAVSALREVLTEREQLELFSYLAPHELKKPAATFLRENSFITHFMSAFKFNEKIEKYRFLNQEVEIYLEKIRVFIDEIFAAIQGKALQDYKEDVKDIYSSFINFLKTAKIPDFLLGFTNTLKTVYQKSKNPSENLLSEQVLIGSYLLFKVIAAFSNDYIARHYPLTVPEKSTEKTYPNENTLLTNLFSKLINSLTTEANSSTTTAKKKSLHLKPGELEQLEVVEDCEKIITPAKEAIFENIQTNLSKNVDGLFGSDVPSNGAKLFVSQAKMFSANPALALKEVNEFETTPKSRFSRRGSDFGVKKKNEQKSDFFDHSSPILEKMQKIPGIQHIARRLTSDNITPPVKIIDESETPLLHSQSVNLTEESPQIEDKDKNKFNFFSLLKLKKSNNVEKKLPNNTQKHKSFSPTPSNLTTPGQTS